MRGRAPLPFPPAAAARAPAAVEEIGRGDGEEAEARHIVLERVPCGKRLGRERSGIDEHGFGTGRGLAQPIAAGDRTLLPALVRPLDLLDRARRQPQVDALAILLLHQPEAFL